LNGALKKRGVRFEIAEAVLLDPNHIRAIDDHFDYAEEHLVALHPWKTEDNVQIEPPHLVLF